jgi:cytochrome P450
MLVITAHLGRNPRVLEKIRQEIGPEDLDDVITLRDIERYKYVNDVVKEVLRVTPPVGAGYRKVHHHHITEIL